MKKTFILNEDFAGKRKGERFILNIDNDTDFAIVNNNRVYLLRRWKYKGCTIEIKTNSEIIESIA